MAASFGHVECSHRCEGCIHTGLAMAVGVVPGMLQASWPIFIAQCVMVTHRCCGSTRGGLSLMGVRKSHASGLPVGYQWTTRALPVEYGAVQMCSVGSGLIFYRLGH